MGQRAQDFPPHHALLVTCKNAINPRVTNGAITVAAEMRFPRWFEPYICLALGFRQSPSRVAEDGIASRLVVLRKSRSLRDLFAGTGLLRVWVCHDVGHDGGYAIVVLNVED